MKVVRLTEWEDTEISRDIYYHVSDDDFQKIKHLKSLEENRQIVPADFLDQARSILAGNSVIQHDLEVAYCLK